MRDEIFMTKVKQLIKEFDELDNLIETQPQELQKVDYELSDLYHIIENQNLTKEIALKITDRIRYLRLIRRSLQREYQLENTYKTHYHKLTNPQNRPFLINELQKTLTSLNNEYKNRVLTDEDLKTLLEKPQKKRGRPPKNREVITE